MEVKGGGKGKMGFSLFILFKMRLESFKRLGIPERLMGARFKYFFVWREGSYLFHGG